MKSNISSKVIGVRLSPESIASLDKLAKEYGVRRATVIRNLLENGATVYKLVNDEIEKRRNTQSKLVQEITRQVRADMPDKEISPTMVKMTVEMVKTIMQRLMEEAIEQKERSK